MLMLLLISFLAIGAASIYYFKTQNDIYHNERLKRKERTIMASIDYFLRRERIILETDSIVRIFDNKICELADVNNLDINIYDLEGQLLISSHPQYFYNGIFKDTLRTRVIEQLKKQAEPVIVEEQSDTLNYLSTYIYIDNDFGEPMAIVNIPYFKVNEANKQELKAYLVRLSEIYVLLFIGAILLAYFLSNYITGSLKVIREKLRDIRIYKQNQQLEWGTNDEIGNLVSEYNRMVRELEHSAAKLAKSERESAWKEMAKQVAHEIKNPLTPMKLSVQMLQRNLKTDEKEKLKNFTETMVHQIDTLSSIATAFSGFANMPSLKKEPIEVSEMLERSIDLYKDIDISFENKLGKAFIKADREQLIRVMNNLIKNAKQAIPDDREAKIEVVLEKKESRIEIRVKDNGKGIPLSQRDRIFEPSFTTKTSGMGLGLAMVKEIIDNFEGKISFESELDQGTCFIISLPEYTEKTTFEKQ